MNKINKSDFISYIKGNGYCWLNKFSNLEEAVSKDELISKYLASEVEDRKKEKTKDIFEAPFSAIRGNIFGEVVIEYSKKFANDNDINWVDLTDSFFVDYDVQVLFEQTKELLTNNEDIVINEATFVINIDGHRLTSMVDMLVKKGNTIKIYEAKASTKIKSKHILDIYFQKNIIERALKDLGYQFEYNLMVISNDFRLGSEVSMESFTQEYYRVHKLENNLLENLEFLNNHPDYADDKHNKLNKKEWDYIRSRAFQDFDDTIRRIIDIQAMSFEDGIWKDVDISMTKTWVDSINPAIDLYYELKYWIGDKDSEDNVLKQDAFNDVAVDYKYPLYMYDFESIEMSLPIIEGAKGYQQVISQYSIHIIKDKNFDVNDPSTYEHREYLINDFTLEEIKQLWRSFVKDMDNGQEGTPVAWYKPYETSKIKESLESNFIDENIKYDLAEIRLNTIDLRDFFATSKAAGRFEAAYNCPSWEGKTSIKLVGPHCAPNITYEGLKIANGSKALEFASKFAYLVWDSQTETGYDIENIINRNNDELSKAKWQEYRKDLLKYCEIDTKQMVGIWQFLLSKFDS